MRVRLLTPTSGDHNVGDELDLPKDDAERRIAAGHAVAIDASPKPKPKTGGKRKSS